MEIPEKRKHLIKRYSDCIFGCEDSLMIIWDKALYLRITEFVEFMWKRKYFRGSSSPLKHFNRFHLVNLLSSANKKNNISANLDPCSRKLPNSSQENNSWFILNIDRVFLASHVATDRVVCRIFAISRNQSLIKQNCDMHKYRKHRECWMFFPQKETLTL